MRKITKDRLKMLEEESEYNRRFRWEQHEIFHQLLDYLGLGLENVPSGKIIKDLSRKEGKQEEEKWPQP